MGQSISYKTACTPSRAHINPGTLAYRRWKMKKRKLSSGRNANLSVHSILWEMLCPGWIYGLALCKLNCLFVFFFHRYSVFVGWGEGSEIMRVNGILTEPGHSVSYNIVFAPRISLRVQSVFRWTVNTLISLLTRILQRSCNYVRNIVSGSDVLVN